MKNIKAFSISAITSVAVVTVFTIIGELVTPFKDVLKAMTGHHWITKSVLAVIIFVGLGLILNYTTKANNEASGKYIWGVFWTAIIGSIVLLAYFIIHAIA